MRLVDKFCMFLTNRIRKEMPEVEAECILIDFLDELRNYMDYICDTAGGNSCCANDCQSR